MTSTTPDQVTMLESDLPDKPVCEGEGVCGCVWERVVYEGKCVWHERCVVSIVCWCVG